MEDVYILAIESSCDETSMAIVNTFASLIMVSFLTFLHKEDSVNGDLHSL